MGNLDELIKERAKNIYASAKDLALRRGVEFDRVEFPVVLKGARLADCFVFDGVLKYIWVHDDDGMKRCVKVEYNWRPE